MKKVILSFMTLVAVVFMLVGCGDEKVTATGIAIEGPLSVKLAETQKLTVKLLPNGAEEVEGEVQWTSSNNKVASVAADGTVTGVKEGKANITAKLGEFEATVEVNVLNNVGMYYQTYETDDLGTVNYWDSKESVVGDLTAYVFEGFWGTRLNDEKDGYEWYPVLANEKPVGLVNGEPVETNVLTKTYKFEVKVGSELKYNTLSKVPEFAKFKGQEVQLEDYITTWKHFYNQSEALERGPEELDGSAAIKGIKEYYNATKEGFNEEAWNNVGITPSVENGKSYLTFEFVVPCNAFYAMYYLASSLYTPMPEEFVQLVGGLQYVGTWSKDNKLSPVDTTLATGNFVIETWETDKVCDFKKNEFATYNDGRYNVAGIHVQILPAAKEDQEAGFKEFLASKLDASSIPSDKLDEYRNDPRTTTTLDSSTYKLNLNTCNEEQWEALFGENGTIAQTPKDKYWDLKPIMSNANFLRGLNYSIDRKGIADLLGRTATGNYFGSSYLSNPEEGISYNTTEAHRLATEASLANTDGYGFNKDLAEEFFEAACKELVENGVYERGQEIHIEIAWQSQSQVTREGAALASFIEEPFNKNSYGLKLVVDNFACAVWSDVYYKKMMVGQFDLGFGSISGNSLNPINFLEVLKSDNSSGFTLNWGVDTSIPTDEIQYDGRKWSFASLWQAADQGALVNEEGNLIPAYDAVLVSSKQNEDGSRTVKISYALSTSEGVDLAVDQVVVCNYQRYYYGDGTYEEEALEFETADGIITATIPAELEQQYKGYIGFDIYFTGTLAGVEIKPYVSLYSYSYELEQLESGDVAVTDTVYEVVDDGRRAQVDAGGVVKTYVASTYEERTEILGILEKYAVEHFITGLTMYGDGGYAMYQTRLEPGSGSWENYVPGYGFGVTSDGRINGLLKAAN